MLHLPLPAVSKPPSIHPPLNLCSASALTETPTQLNIPTPNSGMAQIISIHSIQSPTSTNRHPQFPLQHPVSWHKHPQQAGFHLSPITQRCTTHHPTTPPPASITITTKPPPLPHTLANASSQSPTESNPSSQQNKSVPRNTETGGLPDRVPNMQGNMQCHAMPCRCHLSVPIHEKTRLLSITSPLPPPSSKTKVSTFNKPHTPAAFPPAGFLPPTGSRP